jgi:hypothetical protein
MKALEHLLLICIGYLVATALLLNLIAPLAQFLTPLTLFVLAVALLRWVWMRSRW